MIRLLPLPLGALLCAQDPLPQPAGPDAAQLSKAREAVRALGAAHRELQQLACDYEQIRTSELLVEPLHSEGRLRWRRDPACLVFEVTGPPPARLRLDEERYEVLRPARKQLERFAFAGPELPRALLDAFAPDLDAIEERMRISAVEAVGLEPQRLRIQFTPRDAALQDVLSTLQLELDPRAATLQAIAYTDAQGDRIELRLRNIERDPKLAPEQFELRAEPGTRVLEHPPPKPKEHKPAARPEPKRG